MLCLDVKDLSCSVKKKRLWDNPDSWPREPLKLHKVSKNCSRSGHVDVITLISCWEVPLSAQARAKDSFPAQREVVVVVVREQGLCTELLSQLSPVCGIQKPHPIPKANSLPGSCRNHISQGFRANIRLKPLINYRVALGNDESSSGKNQKLSLAKSGDLAFLEFNQRDRSFILTLQIYKSGKSTFLHLCPLHLSPSGLCCQDGWGSAAQAAWGVAAAQQVLVLCFSLQRLYSFLQSWSCPNQIDLQW